jgi:hypothetical protein
MSNRACVCAGVRGGDVDDMIERDGAREETWSRSMACEGHRLRWKAKQSGASSCAGPLDQSPTMPARQTPPDSLVTTCNREGHMLVK